MESSIASFFSKKKNRETKYSIYRSVVIILAPLMSKINLIIHKQVPQLAHSLPQVKNKPPLFFLFLSNTGDLCF